MSLLYVMTMYLDAMPSTLVSMTSTQTRTRRLSTRIEVVPTKGQARYISVMRLLGFSLCIVTITFVALLATNSSDAATMTPGETTDSAHATQHLLDTHDCWSGAAPADMRGKIPGHAVVELAGDRGARYVGSQVGFDIWQHVRPGVLYGFCR